ncbi:MAG: hypothetical protein HC840_18980 [Leptolyngbyaceae cyanobacterium RM2_2_4]|nr:hypothetical protein [Leptolyngbyaceae cyanobacterium SM1_4_3]NJO51174.1 hypothetical protein [Leptolyngbyaceae cyanobacterium RM2_2_4]
MMSPSGQVKLGKSGDEGASSTLNLILAYEPALVCIVASPKSECDIKGKTISPY